MNETPVYEIANFELEYSNSFTLHVPYIKINAGDSVGLTGPNGSGKSTLLKVFAFLQFPSRGTIRYRGRTIASSGDPRTRAVTMLLQDPYLLKKSVFENVAYALRVRGEKQDLTQKVNHSLQLVGLPPEKFAKRRWYELSGGESQRVALAARIVLDPDVLILDEPTANMDRVSSYGIKEAIGAIRQRSGVTLIIASHDHLWLNQITTKNLELYEGKIRETGHTNIIHGPWLPSKSGLWERHLPDNQRICAVNPPDRDAVALLDPSNIILSTEHPAGISAQNILSGTVIAMNLEREPRKVRVEVMVSRMPFICSVTHYAASSLGILPGKQVWVVFKASSLHWH